MYDIVSRDRLFYDHYRYCMRFELAHSGRMRSLAHKDIIESCEWANNVSRIQGVWVKSVSQDQVKHMLELSDVLTSTDVEFKRIVFTQWQNIYTNDTALFDKIATVSAITHKTYHEAVIDQPRDTVILSHSDYKWRSYFKERWYSQEQMNMLANFITSRPEQFSLTNNWRKRLTKRYCWITRTFFVDHHDAKDVVMLNMVIPGCVRKTMPIVQKC